MNNNHLLKFALIASLILNITLLATAGYRAYRQSSSWISPFGQEMKRSQFLFEELSLNAEQLTLLKKMTMPFRAEIDVQRQEIAHKRKQLITLLRSENPDMKSINRTISEISIRQEEMQRKITAHMLQVKASIDKENQQKFLDLIESRMKGEVPAGCPPDQHQ